MTAEELQRERKICAAFLAQPDGEILLRLLSRRYRSGAPDESEAQMLNRLGRLDALADLERLREEAKGA